MRSPRRVPMSSRLPAAITTGMPTAISEELTPRFLPLVSDDLRTIARAARGRRFGGAQAVLVTVVVLALLVGGAGALLRLVGPVAPAAPASHSATPTPTPTPSAMPGTVGALPTVVGRTLATWTDATPLPASGSFDLHGKALAITMTCAGGGRLSYSVVGHSDSATGCSGSIVGGPETTSSNGRLVAEHHVTVHLSVTGHPRFAFRISAIAVTDVPDPSAREGVAATGPGVPASLRTCATRDLAPVVGYERWPHFEGGLLTIRSDAATDCALRDQPTLRYLDAEGKVIGDQATVLGNDGGGKAEPVRLAAHGTAYVQIELFTLSRLDDCGAVQVRGLRLGIGHAVVQVSVPASPAVAKCTDPNEIADGVGAATAYRPTGP